MSIKMDWKHHLHVHIIEGGSPGLTEREFREAFDLMCQKIKSLGNDAFTAKTGNSAADIMLRRARVFFRVHGEYGIHPA